jgi:hypothetical protein
MITGMLEKPHKVEIHNISSSSIIEGIIVNEGDTGVYAIGGIIGRISGDSNRTLTITITGIDVGTNITGSSSHFGGLIGYSSSDSDENIHASNINVTSNLFSSFSARGVVAGGVFGESQSNVLGQNIIFNGSIEVSASNKSHYVGGIIGQFSFSPRTMNLNNITSNGVITNLTSTNQSYNGGFIGRFGPNTITGTGFTHSGQIIFNNSRTGHFIGARSSTTSIINYDGIQITSPTLLRLIEVEGITNLTYSPNTLSNTSIDINDNITDASIKSP